MSYRVNVVRSVCLMGGHALYKNMSYGRTCLQFDILQEDVFH